MKSGIISPPNFEKWSIFLDNFRLDMIKIKCMRLVLSCQCHSSKAQSDASLARGFRFGNSRKEKDYGNEVDETKLYRDLSLFIFLRGGSL